MESITTKNFCHYSFIFLHLWIYSIILNGVPLPNMAVLAAEASNKYFILIFFLMFIKHNRQETKNNHKTEPHSCQIRETCCVYVQVLCRLQDQVWQEYHNTVEMNDHSTSL